MKIKKHEFLFEVVSQPNNRRYLNKSNVIYEKTSNTIIFNLKMIDDNMFKVKNVELLNK